MLQMKIKIDQDKHKSRLEKQVLLTQDGKAQSADQQITQKYMELKDGSTFNMEYGFLSESHSMFLWKTKTFMSKRILLLLSYSLT